jgi:hypothetical protein
MVTRGFFSCWAEHRQLIGELKSYSDAELAELGMVRSACARTAFNAALGACWRLRILRTSAGTVSVRANQRGELGLRSPRSCLMSGPSRWMRAAVMGLALSVVDARASDRAEWFESLKVPGTSTGCCSIADCHRTRARVDVHGRWWALLRAEWWPAPKWVVVPQERVLARPRSIDGDAYVCETGGSPGGTMLGPINGETYEAEPVDPTVRCFVPPDIGS